jgi:hypothetical protein
MFYNVSYRHGKTTWRVSDRYERLVTVAAEVLATPCWKHLSQVSVLDSSSSRAVESIVWVKWTFCLCFKISFYWQKVLYFYSSVSLLEVKCLLNDLFFRRLLCFCLMLPDERTKGVVTISVAREQKPALLSTFFFHCFCFCFFILAFCKDQSSALFLAFWIKPKCVLFFRMHFCLHAIISVLMNRFWVIL